MCKLVINAGVLKLAHCTFSTLIQYLLYWAQDWLYLFAICLTLPLVLFILVIDLVFALVIDLDSDRPGPAESHFGHSGISWPRRSRLYTQWKGQFSPSRHVMKSLLRNIPWIYTSDVHAGIIKMLHEFVCYRPEATSSPFLINPKSHGTDCSPGLIPKVTVLLYTYQCLPGTTIQMIMHLKYPVQ